MKREIKLEAWDKTRKEMGVVVALDFLHGTVTYDSKTDANYIRELSDVELREFTGLKDKNGVEIYEGDILRTVTDKNMKVDWSNRFASFVINREGWAFSHWFGEACNAEDTEVIGNIFENPELLNN